MKTIDIGSDFSIYPAGRYPDDGEFNGEFFRKTILIPALISNDKIRIILDGTLGYDSSFLEEAFGGIFRDMDADLSGILEKITLVTEDNYLKAEIISYMSDEFKRRKNK